MKAPSLITVAIVFLIAIVALDNYDRTRTPQNGLQAVLALLKLGRLFG